MSRAIWLVPLLVAVTTSCGKSAGSQEKDTGPPGGPTTTGSVERVQVPGGPAISGAPGGGANATAKGGTADDTRFYLHADEGTLTIDKADGKVGGDLICKLAVKPASEFHVNTEFPVKLMFEEGTPGVRMAKTELVAGGMSKSLGDAATFSEKGLEFAIKATAEKPGSYEIKGTFKFAVCKDVQCFPKKQPIACTFTAS